jgi:hypothetical protein
VPAWQSELIIKTRSVESWDMGVSFEGQGSGRMAAPLNRLGQGSGRD